MKVLVDLVSQNRELFGQKLELLGMFEGRDVPVQKAKFLKQSKATMELM